MPFSLPLGQTGNTPSFYGGSVAKFTPAGKYMDVVNATTNLGFSSPTAEDILLQKENLAKRFPKKTPEEIEQAIQSEQAQRSELFKNTENRLFENLTPLLQKKIEQDLFLSSPEGMKLQLQMAREEATEKGRQGLLFNTLAKLPEAMANAVNPFGGPVGAAMAYQGMSAIPGIYAQTMASFPQIQVPGYSAQQYRYFQ